MWTRKQVRIGTENWNKGDLEAVEAEQELQNEKECDPQTVCVSFYPKTEGKLSFASLRTSSSNLRGGLEELDYQTTITKGPTSLSGSHLFLTPSPAIKLWTYRQINTSIKLQSSRLNHLSMTANTTAKSSLQHTRLEGDSSYQTQNKYCT